MQEFNKVSTISTFIKQLLNTTYLPVVRTVLPGDFILKDSLYLYHCEVIKCTSTGYLSPYKGSTLSPVASYAIIDEYHFGERNGKLCHNFQSNNDGYDTLTHEKLGDYLRALRDMYSLNLMPLYNCFSNNILEKYHIFTNRIEKSKNNYNTKIFKVPIRFNTDYTICIENVGVTTFAPAFIRNEQLVTLDKVHLQDTNIDVTNRYISLYNGDDISSYGGLRFNNPIKIRFDNIPKIRTVSYSYPSTDNDTPTYIQVPVNATTDYDNINPRQLGLFIKNSNNEYETANEYVEPNTEYYVPLTQLNTGSYTYSNVGNDYEHPNYDTLKMFDSVEDTLYLLIQVPKSFNSNIVVLEGDYTHTQAIKKYNEHELKDYPENYLDKLFTSDLKLMRMNIETFTPFSETLEQFLLWNAVCNLDDINLDMDRICLTLRDKGIVADEHYFANYWYYKYREIISQCMRDTNFTYVDDNLGYVTSNIEDILEKGIY